MDNTSRVIVDDYLRMKDSPNIFVCGDANNTAEEKLAAAAMRHSEYVAKCISHLVKQKALNEKYKFQKVPNVFLVALGPSSGVLMTYGRTVLTGKLAGSTKTALLYFALSELQGSGSVSKYEKTNLKRSLPPPVGTPENLGTQRKVQVLVFGGMSTAGKDLTKHLLESSPPVLVRLAVENMEQVRKKKIEF